MKAIIFMLVIAGTLMGPQVRADQKPGQGHVSIMGTYVDDDKNRGVDDDWAGGQIGFGTVVSDHVDLDAFLYSAHHKGFHEQDHFGMGVDAQWLFTREGRLNPYVFAGIGYFNVDRVDIQSQSGGMYSAGVGLFARVFGNSDVALRTEYRYRRDDVFSPSLDDQLFSIGLQIPFGERAPRIVDSDADGVSDGNDLCPGTPAGTPVDGTGCETDSDNDGVADSADRCPGTRAGVRVDARGCAMDADGDGVSDDLDRCPRTVSGASVDASGCEQDSDDDSVVDRLDKCPATPAGVQVDVAGCEIKAEIQLPGVNFESNSDRLLSGAEQVLADAAATLKKNPDIEVEVAGHTDSDGTAAYNETLSERRAIAVRNYLSARGVDASRMSVRGYGEAQPIADNSTADGKARNRRVVLRVTAR